MFRDALATPTRTDDAAGVLVVGTVLTLVSWVVTVVWVALVLVDRRFLLAAPVALAPTFLRRGYFVRVVGEAVRTGNTGGAPSFVRWGVLYRDGVKSAVLSAVYLLPLVAIGALGGAAGFFVDRGLVDLSDAVDVFLETGRVGGVPVTDAVVSVLGGFVAVLAVGYLVAFAYVRPAALARFAASGRLRDAFSPVGVVRTAVSGDYAAGWLLAMLALLTGTAIAAPFVPLLVGVTVVFTTRVVVHSLYGRGAAASLGYEHVARRRAERASGRARGGSPAAGTSVTPPPAATEPESVHAGDAPAAEPPTEAEPASLARAVPDEPSPEVQTGRTVPLTGTDILPRAAAREAARAAGSANEGRRPDEEATGVTDAEAPSDFEWGPDTEEG